MPTVNDIEIRKPSDQEADSCKGWPVWTCDPSTFDWDYTQTETCLIMDGNIKVTDRPANTEHITAGPGDLVVFPKGLKCVWHVQSPVKKHYSFSD